MQCPFCSSTLKLVSVTEGPSVVLDFECPDADCEEAEDKTFFYEVSDSTELQW
jgi:hypothetical protein